MKIQKSRSAYNIARAHNNPEIGICRKELQKLYDKEAELDLLQDKVNRSKPILETIYSKVKRKEVKYEETIKNLQRKMRVNKTLMNQYKELYQQGVRIMDRNRLVDRFRGLSNYRDGENREDRGQLKRSLVQKLKLQYKKQSQLQRDPIESRDKIKSHYFGRHSSKVTKQEIYKKYRQKISEDQNIKSKEKRSGLTAKQLSLKLLNKINSDISQLAVVQRPKPRHKTNHSQKQAEAQTKLKYLQMQREKLNKI